MTYRGKVQGGVVVFRNGVPLPEGTEVSIVPCTASTPTDKDATSPAVWKRLAQLGREVESQACDLPADLAVNHDHYLHGLPKRK